VVYPVSSQGIGQFGLFLLRQVIDTSTPAALRCPFGIFFCGIALYEGPKVVVGSRLVTGGTENFIPQHGGVRVCALPRSKRKVVGIMEGPRLTPPRRNPPRASAFSN
jgi:hypothetical protein